MDYDVIVIGAGLTGLSAAFFMKRKGLRVLVLEKKDRTGGAIRSHRENGFVYEEGPNTGLISNAELLDLFQLSGVAPEIASGSAKKRLILKNGQWHPLPRGPAGFFKTPLFGFHDKVGMFFEPFRKRGSDPDESLLETVSRRIGKSFADYAADPFVSGIYAGDPKRLVTRHAFPKLYDLEQKYGSFVCGAIMKSLASGKERRVSRKVFSVSGGLGTLVDALAKEIGEEHLIRSAQNIEASKTGNGYAINYTHEGRTLTLRANNLVSTVGAYALPKIFPFIDKEDMDCLTEMNYAKVIQVAVGAERKAIDNAHVSFGGLVPTKENRKILGVLLPSFCFSGRAPEGYVTMAVYMGGTRHPEYMDMPDDEIKKIVGEELSALFRVPESSIAFMKLFRHPHAIPQYERSSGKRLETLWRLEKKNDGLILSGNLRDGIGMADRVKQAYETAARIRA
ncbi:MAG: protoporphyrinogen oxidase [Candidatus Accumulibacter sp.]|jgi:oxygen-dependent protoporphyrinogen oxidase|nr:protoporphyrinogen oxidase [Accumulibacter sp.]